MCYKLRKVHCLCPSEDDPSDTEVHTIESFVRCSSTTPCRGNGFGTITQTFEGTDYCEKCLGSYVAAQASESAQATIQTASFEMNTNHDEFVFNILRYADTLLEYALVGLHMSLPAIVLDSTNLYPLHRTMKILHWESICFNCKISLHCLCRPGRNEISWNVARQVRSEFAVEHIGRMSNHTSAEVRSGIQAGMANEVRAEIDQAAAAMGGPFYFDIDALTQNVVDRRFNWITQDMLNPFRPNIDPNGPQQQNEAEGLAMYETLIKFNLIDTMASIIAHDVGVPDEMVKVIASRLLPIVMITRNTLTQQLDIPNLATPWDTFNTPDANNYRVTLPLASNILRDGTFLPALFEMITYERDFVMSMYRADRRNVPQQYVIREEQQQLDGGNAIIERIVGRHEIMVQSMQDRFRQNTQLMVTYSMNRRGCWASLLQHVHQGMEFITKEEIPQDDNTICFIHMDTFWQDVPMEEFLWNLMGGEPETQPECRHRPLRLRNCVRSDDPHAFCMASLAGWTFQRAPAVVRRGLYIVNLTMPVKCHQCMRTLPQDGN